jgi:CheY-like chemotaxis protein
MATVLVVEDEFGIAELLDAVLTEEGYQVVTAMNGRDGLELLARERPVLVLSDYMMPVMDGSAMLARIRADAAFEPRRDFRRLQFLRRWSHDREHGEEICTGSPRSSGQDGV